MAISCGRRALGRTPVTSRIIFMAVGLTSTSVLHDLSAAAAPAQQAQAKPSDAEPQGTRVFNIPPQPLTSALVAFGLQSGFQVTSASGISAGISSPGLSGSFTPEEALSRLLGGTGVTYSVIGPHTVALAPVAASSGSGMTLPPVTVQGAGASESPTGPGSGYVAHESLTGAKTDTPLREIPQSISVVTRQQMDDQAVQNIGQALRYTTGIVPEVRGEQDISDLVGNMLLRGFAPDQYLDGLKLIRGEWGVAQIDPYFLNRIEVLHGPASVLYGQGTPGGIVTMTSKLPTEVPYHEVQLQGGSYDHIDGSFDLSGPVDKDHHFFYRLMGDVLHNGSQVDFSSKNRVAVAPELTWKPDDQTTLTIMLRYQNDWGPIFNNFVPAQGTVLPNPHGSIATSFFPGDPNFDYYRRQDYGVGYQFEHKFNDVWTVRQNVRYQNLDTVYDNVFSNGLQSNLINLNRYTFHDVEHLDNVTLDNQVQAKFATGELKHTVLVGLDAQWTGWKQTGGQDVANTPPINIFHPVYHLFIPAATQYLWDTYETQYQLGLYAQDQVKWGRLSFIFGGREDWAGSNTRDHIEDATTTQFDRAFTYRGGIVYSFDNGVSPYVSYTTSFSPAAGTDFSGKAFTPTTGQQYEVGVKYQPPAWNSFITAAAYNLTQQNVLTVDSQHPQFQSQTGEVRARGVELEAHASITDNFGVILAYSYTDAVNTKSNSSSAGINGTRVSTQGKTPDAVPTNLASLWADYSIREGSAGGLGFGGGVRYVGASPGDPANSFFVPGFTLFDAALHYDLGRASPTLDGLKLQVNASNLFDKKYVSYCASGAFCTFGLRRTVYATIRYQF